MKFRSRIALLESRESREVTNKTFFSEMNKTLDRKGYFCIRNISSRVKQAKECYQLFT